MGVKSSFTMVTQLKSSFFLPNKTQKWYGQTIEKSLLCSQVCFIFKIFKKDWILKKNSVLFQICPSIVPVFNVVLEPIVDTLSASLGFESWLGKLDRSKKASDCLNLKVDESYVCFFANKMSCNDSLVSHVMCFFCLMRKFPPLQSQKIEKK